ncbi:hypothetical protein H8959_015094, partial [Pygathrix nigripes]
MPGLCTRATTASFPTLESFQWECSSHPWVQNSSRPPLGQFTLRVVTSSQNTASVQRSERREKTVLNKVLAVPGVGLMPSGLRDIECCFAKSCFLGPLQGSPCWTLPQIPCP